MQSKVLINSQYIKDFSLEIPHAPEIFKELKAQPKVSVSVNVGSKKIEDKFYEVVLKTELNGDLEDKKFFIVELEYAAVVMAEATKEKLQELLNVYVAQQMFPFVRSIVANIMMEAGLPPIMLTPIDFASLHAAKAKKKAKN